ncbi:MAG: hypothetical protein ABSE22_01020 [Xanthobacteraceae bacterium]|jgi:hypothetical protein
MRTISVLQAVVLATAVAAASFSSADAKGKVAPLPPGACAVGKKAALSGTFCSLNCDPKSQWCQQQLCANGTFVSVLPCYNSGFCTVKCGG